MTLLLCKFLFYIIIDIIGGRSMKTVIEMKNVSYMKDEKIILNSIDLIIKEGEFVSIVGGNGAGKSSLVRVLLGLEKISDGDISICGKKLDENKSDILRHVGVIFENPTDTFVCNKVSAELKFSLRNMNLSNDEIDVRFKEIVNYLNIEHLLDCIPHSLSGGEKQLVSLGVALMLKPDILIVDESLNMVDALTKDELLKLLKKLHKENNMAIIYVTHDLEDTMYTDRVVLLSNGEICLDQKIKKAFNDDKIYRDAGLSLPFMIDLSKKLQYYGLVDKLEFNMDKLVNKLWK